MDWFKDYFAPIVSLLFSTFAFLFTFKNEKDKKFNIDITMLDDNISEYIVDRDMDDEPDLYHQSKFRLLPMIVITNNSSYPVTITELTLNDKAKFGFYTKVGDDYQVTYKSNKKRVGGGVLFTSGIERSIRINEFSEHLLQPPFTIEPFQSKTGMIFFHYNSSLIGKNELNAITSRGSKTFDLVVASQYVSQLISDYTPPQLD